MYQRGKLLYHCTRSFANPLLIRVQASLWLHQLHVLSRRLLSCNVDLCLLQRGQCVLGYKGKQWIKNIALFDWKSIICRRLVALQLSSCLHLLVYRFLHAKIDQKRYSPAGNRMLCSGIDAYQSCLGYIPSTKMDADWKMLQETEGRAG